MLVRVRDRSWEKQEKKKHNKWTIWGWDQFRLQVGWDKDVGVEYTDLFLHFGVTGQSKT